ncbi:MAG: THUMP domain-containing protein [Candidatus Heimdallarchaeota archaeon]
MWGCKLLREFNLFVSVNRRFETPACGALKALLEVLGDETPNIDKTYISGLIVAQTKLDPFKVIARIRKLIRVREFHYEHLLKIRPIMQTFPLDLERLRTVCQGLTEQYIKRDETFRITLERRFTETPRENIIEAAAADINRKVQLENPDKVVFIAVLANICGVSVLQPDDTLSITKEKEQVDFASFMEQLKRK